LFAVLLIQVEVREQVDNSLVPLKKLKFLLNNNEGGMPFYALGLFNAAPDRAKEQKNT
jgi:hypothetical protein